MVMLKANPLIKHLKAYAASLEVNEILPPQVLSWRKKAAAGKEWVVTTVLSVSSRKN